MTIEDAKQRFMNGLDVVCVCRTSIGSSRTPLASWSCWRERATIWRLCGSTFPRCMSGHLAFFFLYVVHHQSFEILMTPKAQPAAVWTADLYRLRHLPNLHWSAAMIRPLMMTRPDEVYNLNLMDLQLFAFFHFNFLPSFRFPAIDGIPSNDWHGALMHQTFRQALPSQKNSWSFNAVCVGLKGSFRVDLIHILFRTVWCILLGAEACTSGEEGPIWPRGFPVIWFKKLSSF